VQPLDPSAPLWADLAETLPVVSIGDALDGGRAKGEVVFDNRRGVTLALEHLHGLGHRRIAVLTSTRASTPDRPADVHVNSEAERLALQVTMVTAPQALKEATLVALEVLSADPAPTAVFCFSDSIAYGVYAATRELGLAVPGDVSVCGYDNHPISALLTPPLTTVDWDIDGIVNAAVRVVVGAIEGKPRRRRIVREPTLRYRSSTGPHG
jgi:DNA-binding LacI/PurR family transcriptional regulator